VCWLDEISGSVSDHFKLGGVVGSSQQRIDARHDGIFDEILAARSALQDRQLLQDDNAFF
jgi:hypothetical protein